jgi:uncharacterized protein DUF4410
MRYPMINGVLVAAGLSLLMANPVAQQRPIMVVNVFNAAEGVELPYDLKQLHGQLVAEFKTMLGKQYEVVTEAPSEADGSVYTLDATITEWRAGNAAKRLLVGMGSGRESSDIAYEVIDRSGKKVLERKDTIRTNFYSQGAGSSGTLAHPIAQKISDRIKDARLK